MIEIPALKQYLITRKAENILVFADVGVEVLPAVTVTWDVTL
jgi:hypothetical protein